MTTDKDDEYLAVLARIERNQAEFSHDLSKLRADLAIITSRLNSKTDSAKKKQIAMPTSSKRSPVVL